MKNLITLTLLITFLFGCFATTDKRIVEKAQKEEVPASARVGSTLSKADFDRYYKVSESFTTST
jgi:hypothetical protein